MKQVRKMGRLDHALLAHLEGKLVVEKMMVAQNIHFTGLSTKRKLAVRTFDQFAVAITGMLFEGSKGITVTMNFSHQKKFILMPKRKLSIGKTDPFLIKSGVSREDGKVYKRDKKLVAMKIADAIHVKDAPDSQFKEIWLTTTKIAIVNNNNGEISPIN